MDDCSRAHSCPSISKEYDVILVGDSSVGKSCILRQMCEQKFSDSFTCTVGVDFRHKEIQLENGRAVKLKIFDTMGEERYAQMMSVYYRGAQAAILVYDITSDSSFTNIPTWLKAIRRYNDHKHILLAVVGNKLDCNDKRKVATKLGRQYAESNGMVFFETSAKTGENVKEVFHEIARNLVGRPVSINKLQSVFILRPELDASRQEQKGCCLFSPNAKTVSPISPRSPPYIFRIEDATSVSSTVHGCSASLVDLHNAGTMTQLSFNQRSETKSTDHMYNLSQHASNLQVLGITDLRLVKLEIQDASEKWFELGLQLGLYHPTLKEIEGPNKSKNDCMNDMLADWLNQKDDVEKLGGPTWQQLSKTLREMKYKTLSKRVEKYFK